MNRDSFDNIFICTQILLFYFPNVPVDSHSFILGLINVKEERQDLNELEEKHQCQKDHDATGEKSVSCIIQITEVQRPFSCSQCGNTFKHKRSLMKHMRIHSGETPFSCCQCGNTFTSNENLKNHMLIHAGIKPFTCSQCGKSFTQKRQLNLLTRTRTWTLSELFVCTCHCFQTDKVKQDKMNLDKLYIILKV